MSLAEPRRRSDKGPDKPVGRSCAVSLVEAQSYAGRQAELDIDGRVRISRPAKRRPVEVQCARKIGDGQDDQPEASASRHLPSVAAAAEDFIGGQGPSCVRTLAPIGPRLACVPGSDGQSIRPSPDSRGCFVRAERWSERCQHLASSRGQPRSAERRAVYRLCLRKGLDAKLVVKECRQSVVHQFDRISSGHRSRGIADSYIHT